MSKQIPNQDTNATTVTLAGHLYLSHFLAAAAAITIFSWLNVSERSAIIIVSAGTAGLVGLLLTLNIQRTIRMLDWALVYLINNIPIHDLPRRGHGPLAGLVSRLHVLVERERPFTELRERQLQQTSEAAAQEERHRLARDLHDSIKQQLFSIHVGTAAVQARWDSDPAGGKAALADVRHSAQAALVEMNALLQQLSPTPLAKVGLVQALQEQAEALGYRSGAEVQIAIESLPGDDRFPEGAQEALFRIAQELLSNVARHARATQVSLTLSPDETAETVTLTITDDGRGFNPDKAADGMGLNNVRQRMEGLNGRCHLHSQPGQGTGVRVSIPLLETVQMKETRMNKPNHFFNRISLIGLGGGLALMLLLYYPLAVVWPGRWLDSWPDGSVWLGWLLGATAVPLTIGIGYLAARQTTSNHRQTIGAAAGGIATAVFYFGLGNAPLALRGSQAIWQHGLVPAAAYDTFLWLLVVAVNGIIWWTLGGLIVVVLAGMILGAAGGRLAPPPQAVEPEQPHLHAGGVVIAFAAAISSLFTLIVNVAIYAQLSTQVQNRTTAAQAAGFTISPPAIGSAILPVGVVFLVYLASMAVLLLLLRRIQRVEALPQHSDIVIAYLSAFGAGLLPAILFIGFLVPPATDPATYATIIAGCLLSLGLSVGLLLTAVSLEKRFPPAAKRPAWADWTTSALVAAFIVTGLLALWRQPVGGLILLAAVTAVHIFTPRHDIKRTGQRSAILPRVLEIILSSMLALGLSALVTVPVALGLVFMSVSAISILDPATNLAQPEQTLVEMTQSLYQAQPLSLLTLLIFPAILMLLVIIVARIVEARRS
jgi:signal transduction histidine kinase